MAFEAAELDRSGISVLLGADATSVGSCDDDDYDNQKDCVDNSGTWTVATTDATGISEMRDTVESGVGVLLGIMLVWAGFHVVRRIVRAAARG